MLRKTVFLGGLVGVILGFSTGDVLAQSEHENHSVGTVQNNQFQRIEQPLVNKIVVTLGGLGILGLQLWWFLLSKPKSQKAVTANGDFQEIDIIVDGGYDPSRILVQAGKPVRLKFVRKDPGGCLEQVIIPDFHIATDLPVNQITTVEFTPEKPGIYLFSCGMNMLRGEIHVEVAGNESKINDDNKNMIEKSQTSAVNSMNEQEIIVEQKSQQAIVMVDQGYLPNRIIVKAGKKVKLDFLRGNPSNCLAKVVIPDFGIAADLPLNKLTSIEFTPEKPGEYAFTCGMKMFRGAISVQPADS